MLHKQLIGLPVIDSMQVVSIDDPLKEETKLFVGVVTESNFPSTAVFYKVEFMDGFQDYTWYPEDEIFDMHQQFRELTEK